ncbi:Fc receptor-like protein 3 isoform X2 [Hyperolius riggenbachi]|uniref:Fc receptor-like protein 3 isoform X2 n=1 Tax=Hyperolius riggenbachi TaxID=752182 RepID=UPI0035A39307
MIIMYIAALLTVLWPTFIGVGANMRPVVSFNPNWSKIFYGESTTMTCNLDSTKQGDIAYHWYKDDNWIHTGKSYTVYQAEGKHSGNYQCQIGTSERSDSVRLDVKGGYVILQAPLHVYEGDNVTLRCHHYPEYAAHQTVFSKDQNVVQDWGDKSELLVTNVDRRSIWKFACTKQVKHHLLFYRHSDESTISVQELFTYPVLRAVEGNHVTLTCETSLSPLRQTTELWFAFYRDGEPIQNFSRANTFIMNDSGTYTCQVKTASNTVKKTSMDVALEVEEKSFCCSTSKISETNNESSILYVTWPVVLLIVLAVAAAIFICRKQIWTLFNNQQHQMIGNSQSGRESENCELYTNPQKCSSGPPSQGWQSTSSF